MADVQIRGHHHGRKLARGTRDPRAGRVAAKPRDPKQMRAEDIFRMPTLEEVTRFGDPDPKAKLRSITVERAALIRRYNTDAEFRDRVLADYGRVIAERQKRKRGG